MPDFFERLATRSAGLPGPRPRALPRLAHPFERAGVPEVEPVVAAAVALKPVTPTAPVIEPKPGVIEHHVETVHHERESRHSTVVERHLTTVDSSVHHVLERLEVSKPPLLVPAPGPAPVAVPSQPPRPAGVPPASPQPAAAVPRPARPWTVAVKAAQVPVPARRSAPEPERVVHVSIGRVEVKAAAPAVREPRSSGRLAPAVPLEKYLAREGS